MKTKIFDEEELKIAEGIDMEVWKAGYIKGEPIVSNEKVIGWISSDGDEKEK